MEDGDALLLKIMLTERGREEGGGKGRGGKGKRKEETERCQERGNQK